MAAATDSTINNTPETIPPTLQAPVRSGHETSHSPRRSASGTPTSQNCQRPLEQTDTESSASSEASDGPDSIIAPSGLDDYRNSPEFENHCVQICLYHAHVMSFHACMPATADTTESVASEYPDRERSASSSQSALPAWTQDAEQLSTFLRRLRMSQHPDYLNDVVQLILREPDVQTMPIEHPYVHWSAYWFIASWELGATIHNDLSQLEPGSFPHVGTDDETRKYTFLYLEEVERWLSTNDVLAAVRDRQL